MKYPFKAFKESLFGEFFHRSDALSISQTTTPNHWMVNVPYEHLGLSINTALQYISYRSTPAKCATSIVARCGAVKYDDRGSDTRRRTKVPLSGITWNRFSFSTCPPLPAVQLPTSSTWPLLPEALQLLISQKNWKILSARKDRASSGCRSSVLK